MRRLTSHGMSLLTRLLNVLRRAQVERECDHELRFHLDQLAAKYVRKGMTEDAAQLAARARLGDATSIKSAMLEVRMMNRSVLAGVLTGVLLVVAVGAMIVPASIAWMNQTPTVQFIPGRDDNDTNPRTYYTSPLVTLRCSDGKLQHAVTMSQREPPTAAIVPPPGCEIVSVRRP